MPKLTLPDGGIWGYIRTGSPGGRPVLVHHGLIGDAAFGPIWNELGKAAGIEWIMLERPGYGATPPIAMAALSDWPAMIAPVLTELRVTGRFDVVGMSAGAPCAYACAAGLSERVGRVGILSGVPFLHAPVVLDVYPPEVNQLMLAISRRARRSCAPSFSPSARTRSYSSAKVAKSRATG